MKYGIVRMSLIPIRKEPGHRSELVNQLLFNDLYEVTASEGSWLQVKSLHDAYVGWIDSVQHSELTEDEFNKNKNGYAVAFETLCMASSNQTSVAVPYGSFLSGFDGLNFRSGKEKWVYNGKAVEPDYQKNIQVLDKICSKFINAPYLWGGRSPLGIDCSGFTQVVFRFLGISLQRDAYQQAEQGTLINFVEESQPGDLAFFHNDEGKIIHVGIVLKDQFIIHSSGKVRIDRLDHFGIYNSETSRYSHKLKMIKRIVP